MLYCTNDGYSFYTNCTRRWRLRRFDLQWIEGKNHAIADALYTGEDIDKPILLRTSAICSKHPKAPRALSTERPSTPFYKITSETRTYP